MDTFEEVVDNYLSEHDYLGESDPQVFAWRQAALQLDNKHTIALFKEFNALTRAIKAQAPTKNDEEDDPLLSPSGSSENGI